MTCCYAFWSVMSRTVTLAVAAFALTTAGLAVSTSPASATARPAHNATCTGTAEHTYRAFCGSTVNGVKWVATMHPKGIRLDGVKGIIWE